MESSYVLHISSMFVKYLTVMSLSTDENKLCVSSCFLWIQGAYFWTHSSMWSCDFADTENTEICFLLIKWPSTIFSFLQFWVNFLISNPGEIGSQTVWWVLNLICVCTVRCMQLCSSCTLVLDKKWTELPGMDSIENSFPICRQTVVTECRNFSCRNQLSDPTTEAVPEPYYLWAWLPSPFLSQNHRQYVLSGARLELVFCLHPQTSGLTSCKLPVPPFLRFFIKWMLVNS